MTEATHCVYRRDLDAPKRTIDEWVRAGGREVARGSRDYCDGWVAAMRQAFPFGRVQYFVDPVPRVTAGEEEEP